jgi:hypothetical protein
LPCSRAADLTFTGELGWGRLERRELFAQELGKGVAGNHPRFLIVRLTIEYGAVDLT